MPTLFDPGVPQIRGGWPSPSLEDNRNLVWHYVLQLAGDMPPAEKDDLAEKLAVSVVVHNLANRIGGNAHIYSYSAEECAAALRLLQTGALIET